MNATRTTVAPAMKAAADDICGEYSEVFSADTRDMMGFFVLLRRLLQEVDDLLEFPRPMLTHFSAVSTTSHSTTSTVLLANVSSKSSLTSSTSSAFENHSLQLPMSTSTSLRRRNCALSS